MSRVDDSAVTHLSMLKVEIYARLRFIIISYGYILKL